MYRARQKRNKTGEPKNTAKRHNTSSLALTSAPKSIDPHGTNANGTRWDRIVRHAHQHTHTLTQSSPTKPAQNTEAKSERTFQVHFSYLHFTTSPIPIHFSYLHFTTALSTNLEGVFVSDFHPPFFRAVFVYREVNRTFVKSGNHPACRPVAR